MRDIIILVVVFLTSVNLKAGVCECNAVPNTSSRVNVTWEQGQTFFACEDGQITSLTIPIVGITSGDVQFKIATGSISEPPEYSQTVNIPNGFSGDFTVDLSTPFPVSNGILYAFSFDAIGSTEFQWRTRNLDGVQCSGNRFHIPLGTSTNVDLLFSAVISPASVANVPTLTQWTLIMLSLLMVNLGVVAIRSARQHTIIEV